MTKKEFPHEPSPADEVFSDFDADRGSGETLGELRRANAALQAEVSAQSDRALRAEAEIDNTRKRVRRDFEDQLRYAALPLVKDVLNALDNLDRALAAAPSGDPLEEGVRMVADQIRTILASHHCRAIDVSPGAVFDPHLHEALGQEPSAQPAGSVSRVVRAGYQMHDRVVRAAQVLISAGRP